MKKNNIELDSQKWDDLVNFISLKFSDGQQLNLQAVLFLIGINELGQGYRDFTKDEKVNLLHIAICKLLSRYGYYEYVGKDKDGWPHWQTNPDLPEIKPTAQTVLIKKASILYFEESGILF